MGRFLIFFGVALFLTACTAWFVEPYPDLVETEKPLVADCSLVGVVTETADAANPISLAAQTNMVLKVRERAGMLGATHIVWLHKTATMATAEAYQCR